jgi:hypothetical protein
MSHHRDTGSPAAGQGNDVPMSHPRDTKSPAAEQDDDVQMSNTIDIYRPKTWEQLEGQDGSSAIQAATVSRDQLPLWFIRMVERMNVTERDVQGLFQALQQEGVTVQADISQMKALYQEMAETMQNAYDVVIKRGDIDREMNHAAIVHLVQASNEFGTQVWQTMGNLATDIQQKQAANQEATQRLTTGVRLINDVLESFTTFQVNWNKGIENWASKKEDGDRKRDKRIRALAKAEERQHQRQLEYETAREQEKKELIDRVIQTVMDRMANKQPIDAQSLNEAMQEPNRRPPSPRTFNAAIGTALPPSHNGTDLGSNAGNGGKGNGPPRRRVGLPPSDPSDSSSSDEGSGPRRRIPINPSRRRRDPRPEEEEDKAERFFQSLFDRLTQPTATEIARKPKMPEMKAPQIFTGKDKTLFRAWWMSVQDYVETYSSAFPDEDAQVKWVGSLFSHKALSWHQERRKAIKSQGLKDNWAAFSSAIEARFMDRREVQKDERCIRELQYEGDIDDYITKLEDLNMRVGASGPMFRAVIWDAMTPDIKKIVYQAAKGIPRDDDAMIEAVKEAAYIVENIDEEIKGPKKRTLEVRENRPAKEAARPHEAQQKDRKVKDKGTEKKGSSGKNDKKSDKPAIFASGREALQNVPQSEIDKHKKDKADCWRCGRSGHKMYECYAKKTVGGTDLSSGGKTASLGKRKRDNEVDDDKDQEKSKGKDKKAKTAAVRQNDEDIDIPDAQPRIWELEESDDMESDF